MNCRKSPTGFSRAQKRRLESFCSRHVQIIRRHFSTSSIAPVRSRGVFAVVLASENMVHVGAASIP